MVPNEYHLDGELDLKYHEDAAAKDYVVRLVVCDTLLCSFVVVVVALMFASIWVMYLEFCELWKRQSQYFNACTAALV